MFPSPGHCWVRQGSSQWPSLFLQPGQHGIRAVPACATSCSSIFSLVPICFFLTPNFLHATSLFLKCSTRVLAAATHLGIANWILRVLHSQVEGVSCTFHRCPSTLFMQNLHCCYNISAIVMGDGPDFLQWNVEFGNYLNPFCIICSYVSLFQGCCQAAGHHFPIIQMVAHHPHISLYCENHDVSLLQGFLHLLFLKKVLDGSS